MKRLVLFLAAVALTACADTAPRHAAPTQPAAKNLTYQCSRSGYMVAYNNGVAVDSTYGCTQ